MSLRQLKRAALWIALLAAFVVPQLDATEAAASIADGCDCSGGVASLLVEYDGPAGATVSVYSNKKMKPKHLIESYEDVMPGDILEVEATDLKKGKFTGKTFLVVEDTDIPTAVFLTSCKKIVLDTVSEVFTLITYTDKSGSVCDEIAPDAGCECSGGVSSILVEYDGPAADTVSIYFNKKLKPKHLIASFDDVIPGDILEIDATDLKGGKFKKKTFFVVDDAGSASAVFFTNCKKVELTATDGDFTLVGYTDVAESVCELPEDAEEEAEAEAEEDEDVEESKEEEDAEEETFAKVDNASEGDDDASNADEEPILLESDSEDGTAFDDSSAELFSFGGGSGCTLAASPSGGSHVSWALMIFFLAGLAVARRRMTRP